MEIYENLSLEDLPNEEWRDVVGYEGSYQVSNMGRVKSIPRYIKAPQGKRLVQGKIIKQRITKEGYLYASLWSNNIQFNAPVHKLVLNAFVENTQKLKEVNHIDENKKNNFLHNLEYCTRLYNINYGTRIDRQKKSMTNHPSLSKRVYQYDLEGIFIKEYPSVREASRQLGLWSANISRCCRGEIKYCKGYIFKYK